VVAAARDPSSAGALSNAVTPVTVDLSTAARADHLISSTIEAHGRVDVLVNNVGTFPFRDSFLTVSDADWNALMDVNFYSMVRACRAALPHMVDRAVARSCRCRPMPGVLRIGSSSTTASPRRQC
jgi:NAD(P)-dependent dehydrogenase (short-subunit alcohol dehydrogenase family)